MNVRIYFEQGSRIPKYTNNRNHYYHVLGQNTIWYVEEFIQGMENLTACVLNYNTQWIVLFGSYLDISNLILNMENDGTRENDEENSLSMV